MRILLYSLFISLVLMLGNAFAHETDGWKHLEGRSGSIIGGGDCGFSGIQVWDQDLDNDGKLDTCTGIFMSHDKFHVTPYKMRSDVPACTCEKENKKENEREKREK